MDSLRNKSCIQPKLDINSYSSLVVNKRQNCTFSLNIYSSCLPRKTNSGHGECGTCAVRSFNHLQLKRWPQDINVTPTIFNQTPTWWLITLPCTDLVVISLSHVNNDHVLMSGRELRAIKSVCSYFQCTGGFVFSIYHLSLFHFACGSDSLASKRLISAGEESHDILQQ